MLKDFNTQSLENSKCIQIITNKYGTVMELFISELIMYVLCTNRKQFQYYCGFFCIIFKRKTWMPS